ncbi:phosphatidylserine/phosphatidylglycerophosphate/cardiolipin synthase family protein [Candidatus Gracilibacteria bacterium]|nr:phosphatidylserine/phosphatidylglycerophosphate/cardiolipin synthase family protein [Candidatus Gracilibacteria bacterium]
MIVGGCSSPYHEHFFRENPEFSTDIIKVTEEIFASTGRVESLPNTYTQHNIIESIQNAKSRIWIEIYTWTDAAKLTDPIIQAKKRGVDIRIVLEGNVFGTPRINMPIAKKLKDAGISLIYADNDRYSFTHAKFWIIDNTYSISTGNWTASFFKKNREYIYSSTDNSTLRFLEEIFISDYSHMGYKKISKIPAHIVISPLDARAKIENLLNQTQENLMIYVQTLDDEHLISIIEGLIESGKHVEICTADNDSNRARQTQYPSWRWKLIRKPYLHAKVIIVDHSQIFIGSHNLTTNAIENNREMGIILHNRPDLIDSIETDYRNDTCKM